MTGTQIFEFIGAALQLTEDVRGIPQPRKEKEHRVPFWKAQVRQVENDPVAYEEAREEWDEEWGEAATSSPATSWQAPYVRPTPEWGGQRMAPNPTWDYGPQGSWGENSFPLQPTGGLVYPQAVYQVAVGGGKGLRKGDGKGGAGHKGKGSREGRRVEGWRARIQFHRL